MARAFDIIPQAIYGYYTIQLHKKGFLGATGQAVILCKSDYLEF